MYLAEQGGSVTTTTNAFSYVAQYSHAAGELSAAAPSHAAWLAPAMGSSGPALSPEPGTHGGCTACQQHYVQRQVIADGCRMIAGFKAVGPISPS